MLTASYSKTILKHFCFATANLAVITVMAQVDEAVATLTQSKEDLKKVSQLPLKLTRRWQH